MTAARDSRIATFIRATVEPTAEPTDYAPLLNASVVVARQHMAAKQLRASHEVVLRAMSKAYRLEASADAERELRKALESWFRISAASLGMATGPKGEDE